MNNVLYKLVIFVKKFFSKEKFVKFDVRLLTLKVDIINGTLNLFE